jgi:putative intracellular protease/amidase
VKLTLVLFDGFTALDVIGGYESLVRLPGVEVEVAGPKRGIVAADTRALGLPATAALSDVTETDILYVPGGPGVAKVLEDAAFVARLRALDATTTWTVGICNGVLLLGAAGLLKGRAATTNFFARDALGQLGAKVVPERFVRADKYITGAGVSASIDTGLYLCGLIAGDAAMRAIALGIEYFPSPPHAEKRPEDIPEPLRKLVAAYDATEGAAQLQRPPLFEALGGAQ